MSRVAHVAGKVIAVAVLGVAGLGIPVLPARADTAASLDLRLEAETLEERVGDAFNFLVTLENTGNETVSTNELDLDIQSVYFHVVAGDEDFYHHRIHDSIEERRDYEDVRIDPGESISRTFSIPVHRAGNIEVTAKYNGFGQGPLPDLITSNAVVVTGRPVEGNERVAARVETSMGSFTFDLRFDLAPNTCLNFMSLVQEGFYEGLTFHRIVRDFVVQGGDPEGTGMGGPGWTVLLESGGEHVEGSVGLARSQNPHSGGSQFYVTLRETSQLDDSYAVFGRIRSGMDVIREIGSVETDSNDRPEVDVVISAVELIPVSSPGNGASGGDGTDGSQESNDGDDEDGDE